MANLTRQIRSVVEQNSPLIQSALRETRNLQALMKAAKEDDELSYNEYLQRLRQILHDHPTAWRITGDLAATSAEALVRVVARDDQHMRESVLAGMEKVRESLGYATSPQLERLLIDQVTLCWLTYEITRTVYTFLAFDGRKEPEHGAYWEKRMASVELRYQRAIESLARTRKLVRSTKLVQINFAQQQIVNNAMESATSSVEPSELARAASSTCSSTSSRGLLPEPEHIIERPPEPEEDLLDIMIRSAMAKKDAGEGGFLTDREVGWSGRP